MDAGRTAASTRPAARPPSICCSRAPTPACAPGRRPRRPNTASWSRTTSSISIADYFTLRNGKGGRIPADLPLRLSSLQRRRALAARDVRPGRQAAGQVHILDENEIEDGIDELGVLLYGHKKNAYWYGSQLSIEETRRIAPYQNATGLAGDLGRAGRHGVGAGKSERPASSRPTRWISGAASKCRCPISAR